MNELCMIIKNTVEPNFLNIRTSIRAYDRDALCCGAPCWRWAYHALHSADKWFINPCEYYLDTLTDEMLYEKPEGCRYTRLELVLRQFRHISFHTGMLNGQTALATGQFPMWVSETEKYVDDGIFFGRYRKGQVSPKQA